jgi:hypothetical protein
MNSFLDDALVGVLLLLSAGYVLSALGPRNRRRRVLAACSAGLARAPAALGLGRAAQRLARAAHARPQGACGGCDDCGSGTPASASASKIGASDGAATKIAAIEIKVPVTRIGRLRR